MKKLTLLTITLALLIQVGLSQVNSYIFNSSSGTYTELTGGTVLRDGTSTMDSWVSAAITIPSFTFNSVAYTTAYVTSNGILTLGGTAPGSGTTTGISTTTGSGISICPFSADLDRANTTAATEIRWETVGNEIIFQWKEVKRYGQTENFSFQIHLNTLNGVVYFIYKLNSGPGTGTTYQPQVGLRTSATDYNNRLVGSGTENWASSLPGTVNTNVCRFTAAAPAKNFVTGLTYTWTPATCFPPTGLTATNITTTGADFSWIAPVSGIPQNYEWKVVLSGAGSGGTAQASGTTVHPVVTASASGLTAATSYDLFVRTDCGGGDYSGWAGPILFATSCVEVTDFFENFNGVTVPALPSCWKKISTTGTINTQTTNSYSAPNCLYMYSSSTANVGVLSMPPVSNAGAGTHRLRFQARANLTVNGIVEVGYLTDPLNPATFTLLQAITLPTTTYSEYIVSPGIAPGANTTFAFRTTGTPAYSLLIDDVRWEEIPSCLSPTALTATNILSTSALLGWTPGGTEPQWNVEVGLPGFAPGTGAEVTGVAGTTSSTWNATGLTASTAYEFYVQADCGGDVSFWAGPFAFLTACAIYTAPYTETFENAGTIPSCWSQGVSNLENWRFSNTGVGNHIGNNGTITGTTTSGAYFAWVDDSSPHNMGTTLQSPFVNVSSLTNPMLFFYLLSNNETYTNVTFSVDVWDGNAWNADFYTHNSNTFNGAWEEIMVNLSSLTITGPVQLRFIVDETNGTDFYDDVAIDDVRLDEAPACPSPIMLTATNITDVSADLGWTENGSATVWNVELGLPGFAPGTGAELDGIIGAIINSWTVTGGTPETTYEFYVQADCGGSNSTWAGPYSFTTLMAPLTNPTPCGAGGIIIDELHIPINVTGVTGTQLGTDVLLNEVHFITQHDYDGDIEISLESPNGVIVDLSLGNGGTGTDYGLPGGTCDQFTNFNMNGLDGDISAGTAPFIGSYIPDGDFSDFNDDSDPNGIWILHIIDTWPSSDDGVFEFTELIFGIPPSCPQPSNLTATGITNVSADLGWTEGGSATTWNVELGLPGFIPGTGANLTGVVGTTDNPWTVTGGSPNTVYEFYVQADCGGGDLSLWSGPYSFTTLNAPLTNPSACELGLPLVDGGCVSYLINVATASGSQLGTDVILTDVNFIATHTWDSDLEITLESPNGVIIDLSMGNGGSADNFGLVNGSCDQFTNFNMDGVDGDISLGTAPFIGSYIPDGNFDDLNDGSNPVGLWTLHICDLYTPDSGTLEYIELVFGTPPPPKDIAWSTTSFVEAIANDGSIETQSFLTLTNETFATTGLLTNTTHFDVANVPAGLTVEIDATSSTEATVTLTGNATNHAVIDNITDLEITFLDAAFTGGNAMDVTGYSQTAISVSFYDAGSLLIINEVDADQTGPDAGEFIELYDGGVGNTLLDGFVLVLYNGSTDVSYAAYDLDGLATDANGYFVIGNPAVPNVDITFAGNTLQNGQDGVALYLDNASTFPTGTAVSLTNLVDALVYDTDDADDLELLVLLNPGQPQINENEALNGVLHSCSRIPNGLGGLRNTSTYIPAVPTPGESNRPIPVMTWDATTYVESVANDGSISTIINISLTDETFATTGILTEATHYTVANVPFGLIVEIDVTSTTQAEISLTGNATNHANIDDIANMNITFLNAAFSFVPANLVDGAIQTALVVDFLDPYLIDITISNPIGGNYQLCGLTAATPIQVDIQNLGNIAFTAGTTFDLTAIVDNNGTVTETITLPSDLAPLAEYTYSFTYLFDFSIAQVYDWQFYLSEYSGDIDLNNDTVEGTMEPITMTVSIDNGDTVIVATFPYTLTETDVYDEYEWTDGTGTVISTTSTVDVNAYGWYYLYVENYMTDCDAIDSILVKEPILADLVVTEPGPLNYVCDATGNDQVPICFANFGTTNIPAGDTIFATLEFPIGTVYDVDTIVLATNMAPLDTLCQYFGNLIDLSIPGVYNFGIYVYYENDIDLNNDTVWGTVESYILAVDLGGVNDTLDVSSYPVTLDAGACTSPAVFSCSYLWNDNSTAQTLVVNADGWYSVILSDDNGCDAMDSVYVGLNISVSDYNNAFRMEVYPNPNNGIFTLEIANGELENTVELVDLQGQIIETRVLTGNNVTEIFDFSDIAKGIYYIKVSSSNGIKLEKIAIH